MKEQQAESEARSADADGLREGVAAEQQKTEEALKKAAELEFTTKEHAAAKAEADAKCEALQKSLEELTEQHAGSAKSVQDNASAFEEAVAKEAGLKAAALEQLGAAKAEAEQHRARAEELEAAKAALEQKMAAQTKKVHQGIASLKEQAKGKIEEAQARATAAEAQARQARTLLARMTKGGGSGAGGTAAAAAAVGSSAASAAGAAASAPPAAAAADESTEARVHREATEYAAKVKADAAGAPPAAEQGTAGPSRSELVAAAKRKAEEQVRAAALDCPPTADRTD